MYALFLSDAIDRVLSNPSASHCWLNLASVTHACRVAACDESLIRQAFEVLESTLPNAGLPGFYLALYKDFATKNEPNCGLNLARASALLPTILPLDLDRMAAYFNFAWQSALARSGERSEFLNALQTHGLPALAAFMGKMVAASQPAPPAPSPTSRPIPAVQKVAVLTPYLLSSRSTPSMMALEQAQLACQNGMKVALFSCQESLIPDFEKLLGNGTGMTGDSYQLAPQIQALGLDLTVAVSDPRFSLLRRSIDMLAQIMAFDPDLVLLVGFHSCLAQALYAVRPILVLGVNSVAPMVPADVWLSARADANAQVWHPHLPAAQIWHHPYRVRRKLPLATLNRTDLGWPQEAVVCISTAWTSPIKLSAAWLQGMGKFLQQHPHVIWVLLGSDASMEAALKELPAGQLRLLPSTENVMGVFACCDIYVNPPRMGGGFAVADAMAAGLPVLSFIDSDGGDKLSSLVGTLGVADTLGYFTTLSTWVNNSALRLQLGAQCRQEFDTQLDLACAGPSWLQACELALARYQQRILVPELELK